MSIFKTKYDLIVVGGGHAGCEAALAGSKLGKKTLLVTMNMQTIAQMSCNPAMGGIAKGQIISCLLYTSPSPRDKHRSRMPSSA